MYELNFVAARGEHVARLDESLRVADYDERKHVDILRREIFQRGDNFFLAVTSRVRHDADGRIFFAELQ